MRVEIHPNGGAWILHAYQHELNKLSPEDQDAFAHEYLKVSWRSIINYAYCHVPIVFSYSLCSKILQLAFSENEKDEKAHFVIGIVHDGAKYLPDLLDYMGSEHANLTVKAGVLRDSEVNTMSMEQYRDQVCYRYSSDHFACLTYLSSMIK